MRKFLNKTVSALCTLAMCLSLVPCVGYADDSAGRVKAMVKATEVTNPNFVDKTDNSNSKYDPNNYNYYIIGSNNLDALNAPLYIKYDVSEMLDSDGDGVNEYDIESAYVILGNGASNNAPLQLYAVINDDISLDTIRKTVDGVTTYTQPEINKEALLNTNNDTARATMTSLKESGVFEGIDDNFDKLSTAFELTDYAIKKQGVFAVMMNCSWSGSQVCIASRNVNNGSPRLFVKLVKKPAISLSVSQKNMKSPVTLTAAVTDSVGTVDSVRFYVDGTLYTTVTAGTNGVYTASVSDMSKGSHTFKAVAMSGETEKTAAEQVFGVKAASENITNLYRAIISNYSEGSKIISVKKNASDVKWYNTNDVEDGRQVWYYQYDVSALKDIDLSTIESIGMNMTYSQYLSMGLTAYAMKGDYVINENSTYDAIKAAYPDDVEGTYLGKYAGEENNNKEVSLDVTDTLKTILESSDYGLLLTVRLNGVIWSHGGGGKMGNVSPIYFTVKYKDTTPIDIADNGNDITVTVNPSVYRDDGNITVVTAMYNGDMLVNADVRKVNTPNEYTEYTVSKAENTTKTKVFIFDGLTADKAPVPLLKTPWQSN